MLNGASWAAVLGATGAVLAAVDHAHGGAGHAFAAVRPPGPSRARVPGDGVLPGGQRRRRRAPRAAAGRGRVLIVDWDVHHGNGTQALVEHDATIRYVSLHQHPWYPGTGHGRRARGRQRLQRAARARGAARRATWRISGPRSWPRRPGWPPDLVLVSAGFDAMRGDPLGGFTLEPEHYADLTRRLRERLPGRADRGPARGRLRARAGWPTGCWRTRSPSPSLHPARLAVPPRTAEDPVAQPLHMEAEFLELRTTHPFIIARGGQSDYRTSGFG